MKQLVDWLEQIETSLRRVDGAVVHREVHRSVVRGGSESPDIEDLTERVSRELAKKLRREGLL